ncbi:MAG: hypothetical protein J6Q77_03875 [Clostridia bacterium]|nr:hypothetical protein [Clostridia bacterium]
MNSKENIVNDKENQHGTSSGNLLRAGAIYLLLAVYLPFAIFANINPTLLQAISVVATIACAFAIADLSGTKRPSGSLLLMIGCLIFLGSVFCGFVAAILGTVCVLGYLLISAKNVTARILSILPAIAAYAIAVLLVGDLLAAAIAILHVPAAIALAYAFKRKLPRISAICHVSIGILVGVLALASAWFVMTHGFSLDALVSSVAAAKEGLTATLTGALFTFAGDMLQISLTDAKDLSEAVVTELFNMLPAIVIIFSNILAFLIHSVMIRVMIVKAESKEDVKNMVAFEMSLVSAIIFFVVMLAAVVFSDEIFALSVTAENMMIILMPGLIFTAIGTLRAFMFAKGRSCLGTLLYIAIIMSFFYLPSITLPLGAMAGATIIIIHNILKNRAEKNS